MIDATILLPLEGSATSLPLGLSVSGHSLTGAGQ